MVIDLRTENERLRSPRPSDIQIEVPLPVTPAVRQWLEHTLLHIAAAHRRETFKVCCAKGNRSKIAADILRRGGYDVVDLGGVG